MDTSYSFTPSMDPVSVEARKEAHRQAIMERVASPSWAIGLAHHMRDALGLPDLAAMADDGEFDHFRTWLTSLADHMAELGASDFTVQRFLGSVCASLHKAHERTNERFRNLQRELGDAHRAAEGTELDATKIEEAADQAVRAQHDAELLERMGLEAAEAFASVTGETWQPWTTPIRAPQAAVAAAVGALARASTREERLAVWGKPHLDEAEIKALHASLDRVKSGFELSGRILVGVYTDGVWKRGEGLSTAAVAERWAKAHGIRFVRVKPDFDHQEKPAQRDLRLVEQLKPTAVLRFEGDSHLPKVARERGIPVWRVAA